MYHPPKQMEYQQQTQPKQYPAAGDKMKSAILYPYGPLSGTGCCRTIHARHLAITSAIYTLNISVLIVLIYAWRIGANTKRHSELEDVYYGVQIAYFAIIGTQMSMIVLSIMLMFGIYKENPGLIVPWVIGFITFMALEAVAMVYSNVLRDHVNKQFDTLCKAEVTFFVVRAFINVLAMWGVMRFYNLIRSGITWKGPEENGCYLFTDDEDAIDEYYDDSSTDGEDDNNAGQSTSTAAAAFGKRHKYKLIHQRPTLEVIDELEKSVGSGDDEDDSLLVAV